jgi:uncharacterized protein (DUF2236 family)
VVDSAMTDFFPKGAPVRRINNEPAVGLLAGRALALQLAHPAVGQGVGDHSDFKARPFKRLQGTLEAMYSIINGPTDLAEGMGRRIHWIHEFVVGAGYQANTPDNLLWVHATLVDSALLAYRMFVGKVSDAEEATFYQQMTRVAETLGLPASAQPVNMADFRRYFDGTVEHLDVTPTSRDLIRYVIRPALPARIQIPLTPLLSIERLITVGTLPPPIRDQIGFAWNDGRQRRLDRCRTAIRVATQLQPRPIRTAPNWLGGRVLLHQARRHVAQFESRNVDPGDAPAPVSLTSVRAQAQAVPPRRPSAPRRSQSR